MYTYHAKSINNTRKKILLENYAKCELMTKTHSKSTKQFDKHTSKQSIRHISGNSIRHTT